MPKINFSDDARKEFAALDKSIKPAFAKHIIKIEANEPRKHFSGSSCYIIEKAGQGRIVCQEKGDGLLIAHVFSTHKEYERWYRGQR